MNINDTGIFRTSDTRYKHLDGKSFTIVSLLPESEFDKDEVGQMYIVDVDGNRINVYEDELIEAVKTVYKVWMSIEKVVTDKNGAETFSMVRKNINPDICVSQFPTLDEADNVRGEIQKKYFKII